MYLSEFLSVPLNWLWARFYSRTYTAVGVTSPASGAASKGDLSVPRAFEFVVSASSSCGRSVIVLNVFESELSSSSSLSVFCLGLGDLFLKLLKSGANVFFSSALLPNAS